MEHVTEMLVAGPGRAKAPLQISAACCYTDVPSLNVDAVQLLLCTAGPQHTAFRPELAREGGHGKNRRETR